jgi:ABC-type branched-subunit amino acid transport system substrate-binding protein
MGRQSRGTLLALVAAVSLALPACSVHKTSGGGANGIPTPDQAVSSKADTDRGVTKTTLSIGAIVYKEDTFASFGLASIGGKPIEQIIKPFVDDINEHGGIAGRRLVVPITRFSPIIPADQQTACVDQADDKKVFATIAVVLYTTDGERCLASKQTPVLTSNSSSLANLKADAGWVHQISMAKDRIAKNWVDWLIASGTATPASKIGVLHSDDPEDNQLADGVFLPYLKQRGLNVVAQAAFSGLTIDTVTTSAQNAALKFRDAGVNLVLPDLDFLRFFVFLGAANNAGLKPRYSVSDLGQLSASATTNFYPSSFEGSEGVTAYTPAITGPPTVPDSPAFRDCLNIYQAHGQQLSTDPTNRLAEVLQIGQYCESLTLVAQLAKLAGAHLNRASFSNAYTKLGTWTDRVTLTGPLTFGSNKFDGPDEYAVIRWQANCGAGDVSCYQQIEPHKKGRW